MSTNDLEKLIAQATPLPWPDEPENKPKLPDEIIVKGAIENYMERVNMNRANEHLERYAANSILPMSRRCDELKEMLKLWRNYGMRTDALPIADLMSKTTNLLSQIESEK